MTHSAVSIRKAEIARKKAKLKRLILRYKNASEHLSWMGGSHPSIHGEIEAEYKESRSKLYDFINKEVE